MNQNNLWRIYCFLLSAFEIFGAICGRLDGMKQCLVYYVLPCKSSYHSAMVSTTSGLIPFASSTDIYASSVLVFFAMSSSTDSFTPLTIYPSFIRSYVSTYLRNISYDIDVDINCCYKDADMTIVFTSDLLDGCMYTKRKSEPTFRC
jgi:hypothetical protein